MVRFFSLDFRKNTVRFLAAADSSQNKALIHFGSILIFNSIRQEQRKKEKKFVFSVFFSG